MAFVPIENSTEGSISRTHDLLLASPLRLCGRYYCPFTSVDEQEWQSVECAQDIFS
jgi:prephenate dehydratase